jgi:hypothetical protein
MSNAFSKEEVVAFEEYLAAFNDQLTTSRNVSVYNPDSTTMARANDTIWRPQPYIGTVGERTVGVAVTSTGSTQLSVPTTIGYSPNSNFTLNGLELRDALQEGRIADSRMQQVATYINKKVLDVLALTSSLTVTRTTAAGTYDDIALCDTIMTETGVPTDSRVMTLNTRDYNGMAGNLAGRQTMQGKPTSAYERSLVGMVAGFDTFKADYTKRIRSASAATGITVDTRVSGANFYVPKATVTAATGEQSNVDNRFQTITVGGSGTGNLRAGDRITIGGIEAVHLIAKEATGQPKTFTVVSVPSSTTLVITPPIISAQGGTDAELEYQNCIVTPAASAPIAVLNLDAAGYNFFWHKSSVELVTGRYQVPTNAGPNVIRASTDNGIEIVMTKFFDTKTFETLYTIDGLFGVVNLNPEMNGALLFSQTP